MFFKKKAVIIQDNSRDMKKYQFDRQQLTIQLAGSSEWPFGLDIPILDEWNKEAGTASGHYFHQDLWAARKIHSRNPKRHIDVGSRIDGFVAHVASFRNIDVYDIRSIDNRIPGVNFIQRDFMNGGEIGVCDSLSCLHALEHFGLGRYGDTVDAWGYTSGFKNISNLLKKDGHFYFSVPIGPQRIEFNAHRIFSLGGVLSLVKSNGFDINEFSYIDDHGAMHENYILEMTKIDSNIGLHHGCGLFDLVKI